MLLCWAAPGVSKDPRSLQTQLHSRLRQDMSERSTKRRQKTGADATKSKRSGGRALSSGRKSAVCFVTTRRRPSHISAIAQREHMPKIFTFWVAVCMYFWHFSGVTAACLKHFFFRFFSLRYGAHKRLFLVLFGLWKLGPGPACIDTDLRTRVHVDGWEKAWRLRCAVYG